MADAEDFAWTWRGPCERQLFQIDWRKWSCRRFDMLLSDVILLKLSCQRFLVGLQSCYCAGLVFLNGAIARV